MTRVRGELKRVTLGRHPTLKLAEARTLAREAMAMARLGHDPGAAKRAARRPADRAGHRGLHRAGTEGARAAGLA